MLDLLCSIEEVKGFFYRPLQASSTHYSLVSQTHKVTHALYHEVGGSEGGMVDVGKDKRKGVHGSLVIGWSYTLPCMHVSTW